MRINNPAEVDRAARALGELATPLASGGGNDLAVERAADQRIAVTLAETISADPDLPPVRVAFVWGSMFSRYGDVFGPSVNLAARMESVARPGTVLVDQDTAEAVAQALPGGFTASEGEDVDLHGIGAVSVHELTRDRSAPLNLGL